MRALATAVLLMAPCGPSWAQTGNSFVTGDGINRAPAAVLHCTGAWKRRDTLWNGGAAALRVGDGGHWRVRPTRRHRSCLSKTLQRLPALRRIAPIRLDRGLWSRCSRVSSRR